MREFNKKYISMLVAAAIIAIAAFTSKTGENAHEKPSGKVVFNAKQDESVRDSDGDGAPDWEEILRGTDPNAFDDYDPGKITANAGKAKKYTQANSQEQQSFTGSVFDALSQLVLDNIYEPGADIASLKDNESAKKIMAETFLKISESVYAKKNPYDKSDITATNGSSYKNYLNSVADVFEKNFPAKPGDADYVDDLQIIYSFAKKISSGGESSNKEFSLLKMQQEKYESAEADLRAIKVPPEAVSLHLSLLNAFANTALAISEAAKSQSDPLAGLIGISIYQDEIKDFADINKTLAEVFKKNKITFAHDEPGYALQASIQ